MFRYCATTGEHTVSRRFTDEAGGEDDGGDAASLHVSVVIHNHSGPEREPRTVRRYAATRVSAETLLRVNPSFPGRTVVVCDHPNVIMWRFMRLILV